MPILGHNTLPLEQLINLKTHLQQVMADIDGIISSVANGSCSNGAELASHRSNPPVGNSSSSPIADRETFEARWQGKSCRLGNTNSFKLLERLARRPNQFVPFEVLLQDVWDRQQSREAVRSAVKFLRRKLALAGLDDLAKANGRATGAAVGVACGARACAGPGRWKKPAGEGGW